MWGQGGERNTLPRIVLPLSDQNNIPMLLEAFVRYAHFVLILTMSCAIVGEHLLIAPQLPRRQLQRLFVLDGLYGLSALGIVGVGLWLWLGIGKPAAFYSSNPIFHLKLGLFALLGLLSAGPTIFFFRERKGEADDTVTVPARILWLIRAELLLLLLIPLCAALMAQGIGLK